MNRTGNTYVVAGASAAALVVAAVVAFVMLVTLQAVQDWPGLGLGLGGDSGSDQSSTGGARQGLADARALGSGSAGVGGNVAVRERAPAAGSGGTDSGRQVRSSGGTGAGQGTAVSPASGVVAPVQSPAPAPQSPPPATGEAAPPAGGGGPVTTVGAGGAESADTAPQTGSTPPRASRGLSGGSSFSACQLNGSAQLTPALDSSIQAFSYSLSAGLEGCESSEADAPAGGTLSAGEVISAQVTNTLTGETDTVDYQEPVPLGAGSCEESTSQGQALVRWEDGTDTVISYSTTGALDEVSFSGSVTPIMTLTAVDPAPGDPLTLVIGTTRHLGGSATGVLSFRSPEDPSACLTPTGETTIVLGGELAFDSP